MASLNTKSFDTLVSNIAAAIQGAASTLIDLTTGSVLLAACEAFSAVVLWLQGLIIQVLVLTRAQTSTGADLDSWLAQFGFARLAATAATGVVTFSRLTSSGQAIVPIGATIQTADGTEQFTVAIDTTNAAYNASLNGYVLATGVSSVSVPVVAVTAGTGGNVAAGTITSITGSISGIDTVTNPAAFTNGVDAEIDVAVRARFVMWFASLSKATRAAVLSAIAGVQSDLICTITENQDYSGATDYGYFYVVVDDGTGYPSSTILASVGNVVEATRGLSIRYGIFAPVVITATPAMTITSASGYVHANVVAAVGTALQAAINALTLGTSLPYTQLAAIAYSVAGVTNVTSVTLNGGTADLPATNQQVIKCGTPVVT